MERGAGGRRCDRPYRAAPWDRAAFRAGALRKADPGEREGKSLNRRLMKLKKLLTVDALSDARFDALNVGGITADSRKVKPGDLFVADAGPQNRRHRVLR